MKDFFAAKGSVGELFNEKSNSMNLMRLLAATLVIYGHTNAITGKGPPDIFLQVVGNKFVGGVAVDVFFLLSGFLVTASAASGKGPVYYFGSRALRIFPALVANVTILVFILGPFLTIDRDYFWNAQTWNYFFLNSLAIRTEYILPGVFSDHPDPAVNGSLWTLAVEVRLYVLVGILGLMGFFAKRALVNIAGVLLITLATLAPGSLAFVFPYENHLNVAMFFLIGCVAWVNKDKIEVSAPFLLGLLTVSIFAHSSPYFSLAYVVTLSYLVFFLAVSPWGSWFNRVKGDYSYGIYLYGWPAQQLTYVVFSSLANHLQTLISIFLAFALAFASWHLLEKPSLALKSKLPRRRF